MSFPKVLVVIPTGNGVEPECAASVRAQDYPNFSAIVHFAPSQKMGLAERPNYSMNSTLSRQAARKMALASDAEYFLFLDDDVILPKDAILNLVKHRKPLLYGWYKMIVGKAWVAACWCAERLVRYRSPQKSLATCEMGGLGCMLVSRKALSQVDFAPGLNEIVQVETGEMMNLGPCGAFSRDAHVKGFRPLMCGDVICGHKDRKSGAVVC